MEDRGKLQTALKGVSFTRRLAAVLVLLNALVAGLGSLSIVHDRQQDIRDAETTTTNLSTVVEQNIAGIVARADLALLAVRDEYERQSTHGGVSADFNDFLVRQAGRIPEAFALRIADSEGRIAFGDGTGTSITIADRDHFIRARDDRNAGLIVGRTVLARLGQKWVLPIARRINRRDGSFGGIVYALIDIQKLTDMFAQVNVGRYGGVTLRDSELGLIVRVPELEGIGARIGDKTVSQTAKDFAASGRLFTTYTIVVPADQRERTVAIRKVGNLPLYVVTTLATSEYLADWRKRSYRTAAMILAFMVLSAWFGWLLARAWQRRLDAMKDLADSQRQLKTIIDTEPECVKVIAPDGTLRQMNRAGLDMIEADSEEQVIGRRVTGIVAPAHRDAFVALNERVMQGESGILEFEVVGLKGGHRWLETHAVPMRDGEGHITGLLGVTRDVTESKRIQESLKQSEARLKEAQRIAHMGSWELDLATATMKCSEEVFSILKLAPREASIPHAEVLNVIHPDDRQWVTLKFKESIRNKGSFDFTHRLRTGDGSVKYVRELGQTRNDEDGSPLRIVGTIQDVTLGKLQEEALKESEERFKTVADFNFDWEYWRGPNKEFLYLSPSCQRITGYAQFEFIANPSLVERIVHPDDRQLMESHLKSYQDDSEHSLDFRIVRKDGGIRWIAHGCRPVFGKDGEFKGRRVSNRDITERKQAEADLVEAKERLALALDASSLSIWDFDIANGLVYLDAQWAKIIGAPPGIMAMTVEELRESAHECDVERIAKAAVSTFKGISPSFQEEFRVKTASGDWKWIRCSGRVVERDAAGRAERAIGTNLDITEHKDAEEKIRLLAYYDTLTDLPNRRLLLDRLNQALSQAKRFERSLAIMFLDLDNFKTINDTLGHDAGDELLKEVASRLAGSIRVGDTVSRQGGDEFVIVLPEIAHPSDASGVAEKIAEALRKPVHVAGQELIVTGSIGISVYPVNGTDDALELMKKADIAMYAAKKAGRNAYRFFGQTIAAPRAVSQL